MLYLCRLVGGAIKLDYVNFHLVYDILYNEIFIANTNTLDHIFILFFVVQNVQFSYPVAKCNLINWF